MSGGDLAVRVEGANRLASTLRKAGVGMVEMRDANQRAGAIVAAQAQVLAPKRTGRLSGSIKPSRQARRVVIRTGAYRYAWVQEYGSAKRRIAPHAYMRRALLSKQDEAVEQYFREMNRLVDQVQGDK